MGIEKKVYSVRDVVFAEDQSQIRTGHGPHVMATLRNLAVSLLRLHAHPNLARATRQYNADRDQALQVTGTQDGPAPVGTDYYRVKKVQYKPTSDRLA